MQKISAGMSPPTSGDHASPADDAGEAKIFLGTCAWSFEDWRGNFYPTKTAAAEMLPYYARYFRSVEVDSTFYAIPPARTVEAWRTRTPEGFTFASKLPKLITHEKKLRDCERELTAYLGAMEPLGAKLGPILLQFPESFEAGTHEAAFRSFVELLPTRNFSFAVEFRHPSWQREDLAEFLRTRGVALAWNDLSRLDARLDEPARSRPVSADFLYVRLIGDQRTKYRPDGGKYHRYGKLLWSREDALRAWARTLQSQRMRVRRIYLFINNHFEGSSPITCRSLAAMLGVALEWPDPEAGTPRQLDLFG